MQDGSINPFLPQIYMENTTVQAEAPRILYIGLKDMKGPASSRLTWVMLHRYKAVAVGAVQ